MPRVVSDWRFARVDTRSMGSIAARAYLSIGVLAIAAHFALAGDIALYDSLGLASAGLIFFAVAGSRPPTCARGQPSASRSF